MNFKRFLLLIATFLKNARLKRKARGRIFYNFNYYFYFAIYVFLFEANNTWAFLLLGIFLLLKSSYNIDEQMQTFLS